MPPDFYIRIRSNNYINLFVILTRLLIGFAFIPSGLTKLLNERFTQIPTSNPIGLYFEAMYQTGIYWQVIGLIQLGSALLLMTQRYATLGSVIYFTVLSNIWLVTISLQFTGTWIITSLMMLGTILLLCWDLEKLYPIFIGDNKTYQIENRQYPTASGNWIKAGWIIFLINLTAAFITRFFTQYFLQIWGCALLISTAYVIIRSIKELLEIRRSKP